MTAMKPLWTSVCALALAACANGAAVPPAPGPSEEPASAGAPAAGLPPQRLAEGACGLFLFERRPPNRFVVFEDLASRTVKIVHDGVIHELGVTEQTGALVAGEAFRRVYLDPERNMTFILTGEVGEETGSGPRLDDVLLTVRTLDGARTVRPLGGVRSCGGEAG